MLDSSLKSIRDMRAALDEKKISSRELAEEYLKNIRSRDGEIKAYITVTEEGALKQADEAQKLIDAGEQKPLTGIPLAIKDNICTENFPTTCASRMLEGYRPPYSATAAERLEAATSLSKEEIGDILSEYVTNLQWAALLKLPLSQRPAIRIIPTASPAVRRAVRRRRLRQTSARRLSALIRADLYASPPLSAEWSVSSLLTAVFPDSVL